MKQDFKILKGPTKEEAEKIFEKMTPEEMIKKAALFGSLRWAKEAIKRGANKYSPADTALINSAIKGHFEIVKLLVNSGEDIHAFNDAPLRYAVKYGHYKIAKWLIYKGANLHYVSDLGPKPAKFISMIKEIKEELKNNNK